MADAVTRSITLPVVGAPPFLVASFDGVIGLPSTRMVQQRKLNAQRERCQSSGGGVQGVV